MLNKNFIFLTIAFLLSNVNCANAENLTLKDLEFPKPPAYRVGLSEVPETQFIQAKQEKPTLEKTFAQIGDNRESAITDMTYADLSISKLSKEIGKELEFEENDMVSDLTLLWQGAATQSDTINFALYKLANPDADKPDSKSIKKVLTTIASMSTLVGASMASPVFAGSSLIGGNILNIMSQDTKALNYKYTRVNDADMIILIRKIEDLQQNAVNLYYDYMSAKKQLEMTTKLVEERQRKFELAQKNNAPRELVVITDAYYRTAIDKQRTAKSDFFSKRAALEQFVGNETFVQFEKELEARENGTQEEQVENKEYNETIQNVENYTQNLQSPATEVKQQPLPTINEEAQNSYIDEIPDPNLNKMPDIQPLEIKKDKKSELTPAISGAAPISEEFETSELDKIAFGKKKTEHILTNDNSEEEIQPSKKVKTKKIKQKKEVKNIKPTAKKRKSARRSTAEELEPQFEFKKHDKYSTKGFIFLHGQDKETAKQQSPHYALPDPEGQQKAINQRQQKQSSQVNTDNLLPLAPIVQTNSQIQENNQLYNLPPLDEIKAPALDGKGYSIHDFGDMAF
ncbi:unknown [Clostridium sp. CAG:813]|nr:unknown [Clostridium sp. CAG:813]